MVKGSLHFRIKIMYVSLYRQLIYRKEHIHNAMMHVVKELPFILLVHYCQNFLKQKAVPPPCYTMYFVQ